MRDDLAHYIQTHYGTCEQAERENRCECLSKQGDQSLCANYKPTTATTWEELLAQAEERRSKHKDR